MYLQDWLFPGRSLGVHRPGKLHKRRSLVGMVVQTTDGWCRNGYTCVGRTGADTSMAGQAGDDDMGCSVKVRNRSEVLGPIPFPMDTDVPMAYPRRRSG